MFGLSRAKLMRLVVVSGLAGAAHAAAAADNIEQVYRNFCSSCHGAQMQGAMGPSLADDQWLHGSSNEEIAAVIKNGVPKKGMPAWRKSLTDAQVRALVILIRESSHAQAPQSKPSVGAKDLGAAGHSFALHEVARVPGQIWSMDFLPQGTIIATTRAGKLWLIEQGKSPVALTGVPRVWHEGQGGLLEVAVHPQYERNGWIYLTLSDPAAGGAFTKLVRGKIKDASWAEQEDIFHASQQFYTKSGVHFGSRIAFIGEHVYFSVGDRGQRELAQDLSYPYGKIHRLNLDGSVPKDNPFAANESHKNALPSIWSYGHRNPQGIAVHPVSGELWVAEHGPRGGDEINRIEKGLNYGWPVITYGMNYDGSPMVDKTHLAGMQQPEHYWVPSIAVSEIDFYTGAHFPKWQNQLLVGSLAAQELRLVDVQGQQVVSDQLLLKGLGRIRDVANGPDGFPYLVLNNDSGDIYRLQPTDRSEAQ